MKRLSADLQEAGRSAQREIEILSAFRHDNVIRLWGYTTDPACRCLLYEARRAAVKRGGRSLCFCRMCGSQGRRDSLCSCSCMSIPSVPRSPPRPQLADRGALSENLSDGGKAAALTWRLRIRATAGVALALNYLHCSQATPAMHMDVKSANIVLSADFEPKLIDCGASSLRHLRLGRGIQARAFRSAAHGRPRGSCCALALVARSLLVPRLLFRGCACAGLSRLLRPEQAGRGFLTQTSAFQGTPGYICPSYMECGKVDTQGKADVYAFGVVRSAAASSGMRYSRSAVSPAYARATSP